MKEIEKKAWLEVFEAVLSGRKKFDIRLGDLEINEGDILVLREWDNEKKKYTGREVRKKVDYLMKTKEIKFWNREEIDDKGLIVMSLSDLNVKSLSKEEK